MQRLPIARLAVTAIIAGLAALAFFGLFYMLGIAVGLALFAAVGAAAIAGVVWLSLRFGRKQIPASARALPPSRPRR